MPYGTIPAEVSLSQTVTINTLRQKKSKGEKFVTVALYDAPMAYIAQQVGVEVVLIGDSLGMAVLGYSSTVPVSMEQMLHHVAAVARGNEKSLIIADLPFMSYATPEQAMQNATRVMQAGANMVKIEGGEWLAETVYMLTERGIPVCAHLGLTPQSVNIFGGFRAQGKTPEEAERIVEDARTLEDAGANLVVLECVPVSVGQRVTEAVAMPTIGIGAGADTDGQVLVINDILGLTPKAPRFSKNFLKETGDIPGALFKYADDVRKGIFPAPEHTFS